MDEYNRGMGAKEMPEDLDLSGWMASMRAMNKATSYEHYLELVQEEAAAMLVQEIEEYLK